MFDSYIDILEQGAVLNREQARDAFEDMMQGRVSDTDMGRFLTLLAERGEDASEITAAAKVLRAHMKPISAPDGAIDCCGTGGDGLHTLNISTAVALTVAACGVPVAKHGNRAASSKSGAADVLEALGADLSLSPPTLEKSLRDTGFCFLMAPNHHPAMKHVAGVRKSLGRRTVFNLLGPLLNPAGVKRQLVGVPDKKWLIPMAQALKELGSERAWIVSAASGMDEISLDGETCVAKLDNGTIKEKILTPDHFDLPHITIDQIKGGDGRENAQALMDLLNGSVNAYRYMVLANAAAALKLSGKADNLREGVSLAAHAIDNGHALNVLNRYLKVQD